MINKLPIFACFITVRTGSTRLPNKWDLKISGRRMIEHIIDRAKLVKNAQKIVLCTSTDKGDNILEVIAKENNIDFFRGSLEDKLARWRDAATKFNVDYIVTVDGDDPFFGVELIDEAINQMKEDPCDFLALPNGLVCGGSEFCFSVKALNKVCDIKDTSDTEMMWVYFTQTGKFKVRDQRVNDQIYFNNYVRLTLDYIEDFNFFERVFKEFSTNKNNISLKDVMLLLQRKPEIAKINFFRQEEFLANQRKKTKIILKSNNNQ
jgi:spore coat polysaccharide biosynthesis protein SpsF